MYDRKSYLTDIMNTRSSKHQTSDRHKFHLMKRKKFNFKSQVTVTSVRATCICMLCHYRQKYMLFQTSYKTINLMFLYCACIVKYNTDFITSETFLCPIKYQNHLRAARNTILAYQIRISTCFTWTDNSYLTHVISPGAG